jgi:hypothetical protein
MKVFFRNDLWSDEIFKQEFLGRTNRLLSFDMTWTAYKTTPPITLRFREQVFNELLCSNDRGLYRQTIGSPLVRHGPYRKRHVQQFFYCSMYPMPRERVYRAVT